MMERTEMLLAIKANDAINRLNDFFTSATGSKGLEGSRFEDVFCVSRLLYQNCSLYEKDSDEVFRRFVDIASANNLTAEEKYELMTGKEGEMT